LLQSRPFTSGHQSENQTYAWLLSLRCPKSSCGPRVGRDTGAGVRPVPEERDARRDLAWLAIVAVGAVVYAGLRVTFTHEYSAAPWSKLLAFEAPLPFGHRVLVPFLVRPLVDAGRSPADVFAIVEGIAFAIVLVASAAALEHWLPRRRARAGAILIGLVLPLVYVLPRKWPLLYPWDGAALAVLAIAVWAAVRRRFAVACAAAALGAFNRETALLVVPLLLAVHAHDADARRRAWAWAELTVALVIVARIAIGVLLPDNPGPPLHFTIGRGDYRLFNNLRWLAKPSHWAWFVAYVGALPLVWPLLRRRIPGPLHRVALVGLAYFVAALVVANIYEPRAWGESVYLVSLAVVAGVLGRAEPSVTLPRWLARVDRWAAPLMLIALALFVAALSRYRFLPVAQWPMPK